MGPDPDLHALVRQIHAEAAALRAAARDADVQIAVLVAAARSKRERELLRRERHGSHSRLAAVELGEARQVGMEPEARI